MANDKTIRTKDIRRKHILTKEDCFICEKHKFISELHHLKTLKQCIDELNNSKQVTSRVVFLCPNCHSYFHKLLYHKISKDDEYMALSSWGETGQMRERINDLRSKVNVDY